MARGRGNGLSRRVADELRLWLRDSKAAAHSPLPSHLQLCKQHKVSLNTLRAALDVLEGEGLIYRRLRSGTFVAPSSGAVAASEAGGSLRCITFVRRDPTPVSSFDDEYLAGYSDALEAHDIKMRFVMLGDCAGRFDALLADRFPASQQGFILVNFCEISFMRWLSARRMHYVVQSFGDYPRSELPPHHSVFVNKLRGCCELVKHLLDLGHRRIGYLGGARWWSEQYQEFLAAMRLAGLNPDPALMVEVETNDVEAAVGPVTEFLKRPDPPTAIVAKTDAIAMATLKVAEQMGMNVPRDLSVTGWSDRVEAARSNPPLTTVATPRRSEARAAVELLLGAAEGKFTDFQTVMLEPQLVLRRSTAPPREAKR